MTDIKVALIEDYFTSANKEPLLFLHCGNSISVHFSSQNPMIIGH